jgi:hypothetical protein
MRATRFAGRHRKPKFANASIPHLISLRSGDDSISLRVETKKTGTEADRMFAVIGSIYQAIGEVAVSQTPGPANGKVWQQPPRFESGLTVTFVRHWRSIHKSKPIDLKAPRWVGCLTSYDSSFRWSSRFANGPPNAANKAEAASQIGDIGWPLSVFFSLLRPFAIARDDYAN